MRMKKTICKRLLPILLCLLLYCAAVPLQVSAATYSGTCGNNAAWKFNTETGLLTISGTGKMTDYAGSYATPWQSYRLQIKTIVVENGITGIDREAFEYCRNLEEITLPEIPADNTPANNGRRVKYRLLGLLFGCDKTTYPQYSTGVLQWSEVNRDLREKEYYFSNIPSTLRKVTLTNCTEVPQYAFRNCTMIEEICLPDGLKSIGNQAFSGCTGLENLTVPDSVTSIGEKAFYGLQNVYYNGNAEGSPWGAKYANAVTEGYLIFDGPEKKTVIGHLPDISGDLVIPDGVTAITDEVFKSCTALTSVTIPSSMRTIGNYAFSGCSGLKSVTIRNGVESFGYDVFSNCDGLMELSLPASLSSISINITGGCDALQKITVDSANTHFSSDRNGVLYNKDKSELYQYPAGRTDDTFRVPVSVDRLANAAFSGCKHLNLIVLPKNMQYVHGNAFASCDAVVRMPMNYKQQKRIGVSDYSYYEYENNGVVQTTFESGYCIVTAIKSGTARFTVYDYCPVHIEAKVSYAWWQWLINIFLLGFIWYR